MAAVDAAAVGDAVADTVAEPEAEAGNVVAVDHMQVLAVEACVVDSDC